MEQFVVVISQVYDASAEEILIRSYCSYFLIRLSGGELAAQLEPMGRGP